MVARQQLRRTAERRRMWLSHPSDGRVASVQIVERNTFHVRDEVTLIHFRDEVSIVQVEPSYVYVQVDDPLLVYRFLSELFQLCQRTPRLFYELLPSVHVVNKPVEF